MRRWHLVFTALALSCKGGSSTIDVEGDEANECRDGADNDQNGYFDCQDNGCWNSPDCGGAGDADTDADSDADSDADTDSDTNVDTGAAAHLESMTLTYDFILDFSSTMEQLTDPPTKDCVSHYVADGTYVTSADVNPTDVYVTMRGSWKLESSTCPGPAGPDGIPNTTDDVMDFQSTDLIWYDPISKESYHTFHFDQDLTYLNTWVAHKKAPQVDPAPNPHGIQFYIYDMFADYDDGVRVVDHTESYTDAETFNSEFTSKLHVEFNAP